MVLLVSCCNPLSLQTACIRFTLLLHVACILVVFPLVHGSPSHAVLYINSVRMMIMITNLQLLPYRWPLFCLCTCGISCVCSANGKAGVVRHEQPRTGSETHSAAESSLASIMRHHTCGSELANGHIHACALGSYTAAARSYLVQVVIIIHGAF